MVNNINILHLLLFIHDGGYPVNFTFIASNFNIMEVIWRGLRVILFFREAKCFINEFGTDCRNLKDLLYLDCRIKGFCNGLLIKDFRQLSTETFVGSASRKMVSIQIHKSYKCY